MRFRFAGIMSLGVLIASAAAFGTSPALKPFERGTWQSIVRGHVGRPVLVHFWGVTCGPCKVELPLLGQFAKDHPDVDVVTVSADLVPNLPAATQSMLDKAGLSSTENFIFNDGFVERLRFEIDPAWQGDIPRTMLITREGTITTIEGSAEIADLERWSAQQLSKHLSPDMQREHGK
ncbi:TlpA disulfide reductase family protein [Bradyrhizobium sp. MOS003]|uniref:TlpA family protein disulfide reductase n=1 Tax=Bradyrhizobium sp. MOS003 TaxID=2133946 RepID=UPI000D139028|nr:TlpA disulfide reductase family protein [Bradyrhizobium sp. MOS003]PSO14564.1 TlpA family protein disulfide reductase [Bradyrhizobium sp. MOS003]